jgi:hypothetical protein
MKTRIDWALGADVRVRDATHNGGEWTLETVRVGPSRYPGCGRPSTSVHSTVADSGFADAGGTSDPPMMRESRETKIPPAVGSG